MRSAMKRTDGMRAWVVLLGILLGSWACGDGEADGPADGDGNETPTDGDLDTDAPVGDADPDWGDLPTDQEPSEEESAGQIRIHLSSGWGPYLYYSLDEGGTWVIYPGMKMGNEGDGWWLGLLPDPGRPLHFLFNDGASDEASARWVKPAGEENCLECHFVTEGSEVWILDGVVYDRRPGGPEDGDAEPDAEPDLGEEEIDAADGDGTEAGDEGEAEIVEEETLTDGDGTEEADREPDEDLSPDGDSTPDGDSLPDGDEEAGHKSFTVHLASGWSQAYLCYSPDGGTTWVASPGVVMDAESPEGYSKTVSIEEGHSLVFVFANGSGDWVHPHGNPTGNFSTDSTEVWVKQGLLFDGSNSRVTRLHLYSGWSQAFIHYSYDGGTIWSVSPGDGMTKESDMWWTVQVRVFESHPLIFLFTNGSGDWHHPSGQPEGNFSTTAPEVWVVDGTMTTEAP